MINKQLVHNVATFHNNYTNNKHIVATIQHFLGKSVGARFAYWSIGSDGYVDKLLFSVSKDIYTKEDYDNYVKEVNDKLNLINNDH